MSKYHWVILVRFFFGEGGLGHLVFFVTVGVGVWCWGFFVWVVCLVFFRLKS